MTIRVCLETGAKKVFASALDWPGWARAGKSEQAALDALAAYAGRYALVVKEAGLDFGPGAAPAFDVVERLPGNATTDFGAPGAIAAADHEPLSPAEAERVLGLLDAAWRVFDGVVATAPAELRKGPRGGGRDRDKVAAHVVEAEASYARMLGVKHKPPAYADTAAVAALRDDLRAAIHAGGELRWPARYGVRRVAWHVLDHAWEIEDRATPA